MKRTFALTSLATALLFGAVMVADPDPSSASAGSTAAQNKTPGQQKPPERKPPDNKPPEKKLPEKKLPEKKLPEKKLPEKKLPEKKTPEKKPEKKPDRPKTWRGTATASCECKDGRCVPVSCSISGQLSVEDARNRLRAMLEAKAGLENGRIVETSVKFSISVEF